MGTQTLAGAVVPLDTCVRNLRAFTQCSAAEALAAATCHPARLLQMEGMLGCLAPGAWADMVLLDGELQVLQTYLAGCLVWSSNSAEEGAAVKAG